jgi:hypothetical protein
MEGGFSLRSFNFSGVVEMIWPSFASTAASDVQAGGKPCRSDDRFGDHYDRHQLPLSV